MDKEDKVDESDSSRIIKNLAKLKSLKNSAEYKKSIRNLDKFKISKKPSLLSSTTKLAYTKLK